MPCRSYNIHFASWVVESLQSVAVHCVEMPDHQCAKQRRHGLTQRVGMHPGQSSLDLWVTAESMDAAKNPFSLL